MNEHITTTLYFLFFPMFVLEKYSRCSKTRTAQNITKNPRAPAPRARRRRSHALPAFGRCTNGCDGGSAECMTLPNRKSHIWRRRWGLKLYSFKFWGMYPIDEQRRCLFVGPWHGFSYLVAWSLGRTLVARSGAPSYAGGKEEQEEEEEEEKEEDAVLGRPVCFWSFSSFFFWMVSLVSLFLLIVGGLGESTTRRGCS